MLNEEDKLKIVKKYVSRNLPFNTLIIPFSYQNQVCYETTIDELTKDSRQLQWKYAPLASEDNELFEHIYHLIGSNVTNNKCNEYFNGTWNNCIGNCLELIPNGVEIPSLGNNKEWIEIYEDKENIGAYRFKNIRTVLFKTGVGFLILYIEYQKSITVSKVARLNSIIKSTKNSKYTFYYNKEFELALDKTDILENSPNNSSSHIQVKFNEQINYIPINKINSDLNEKVNNSIVHRIYRQANEKYRLKYKVQYTFEELIDSLLKGIHVTTFFNNIYSKTDDKFYPKKAHIFSSVLVEKDGWEQNDFKTAFYHLRKGYKDAYLPSESEFNTKSNSEVQKPFLNSYWGVSREGCANLCHLTENKTTNAFFSGNYADRLDNYLYIYLLSIHQYYGLLYLTRKTSELSYTSSSYINDDAEFKRITSLRDEISFFYLKCVFEEISHITHQAKLYNAMIEEFGIRRMQNELHLEMDRIIEIIAQIREVEEKNAKEEAVKIKSQKEERKRKNFKILSIAGALFTFVQTFSAILQTWDITAKLKEEFKGFELVNSGLTIGGTILLGVIIWFIWIIADKKSN